MVIVRSKISHFTTLNDPRLAVEADTLVSHMLAPDFDSIRNYVDAVAAKAISYRKALLKASKGDREMIALKEQAKAKLITALRELCPAFDTLANGNKALYEKATMPTVKEPGPLPPLTDPQPPKLSTPCKGQIKSEGERQKGVKTVCHMISPDPVTSDSWKMEFTTRVNHTFTGLTAGKYWIKYVLIGSKNKVESQARSYMAQ